MMAADLLAELAKRGAIVTQSGDRLLIDAPKGVLTPELKEQLQQAKTALLAALAAPDAGSVRDPTLDASTAHGEDDTAEAEAVDRGKSHAPAEPSRPSIPWRGVVTCWARERGWLAVRDPFTGEWHEIPAREAPPSWIPKKRT
jgi:hypothetical protein